MTRVSIFGLGYVGSVSAACLADSGHTVIGVDLSREKVDAISAGRSPIVEEGLGELMERGVAEGRIRTTTDAAQAVAESDVSLICVGTPSNANGSLDLSAVERVAEDIGSALAAKDAYHVVVVRSTMLPGSTEERVTPALERASGRRAGPDFGVCYNPEFLREGNSVRDFYNPPFTIIGGDDARAIEIVSDLYAAASAPLMTVPLSEAEMVKYVSNAWHALKVTFANEIGQICKAADLDSHRVMELFCSDDKLNISRAYLKPGYSFGGSCLPKDLRALVHHARRYDLRSPVLESILPSNEHLSELGYEMVRRTGVKRVGMLGLSFKPGTDDLRESPLVTLAERLLGKGYDLRVYDPGVSFARIHGANRAYIEREIPHIVSLMVESPQDLVDHADALVVGNRTAEFDEIIDGVRPEQHVIDLVRIDGRHHARDRYSGIAW